MKWCIALLAPAVGMAGLDLDTGKDAIAMAQGTGLEIAHGRPAGWVRLRGADLAREADTRKALGRIREIGVRTCVAVRWPGDRRKAYLPADLREAYENGRNLGAAYGDLVDAWEIDNEPDLGFVPEAAERYTAYLKAMFLGIKAGSKEQGLGINAKTSGFRSQVSGFPQSPIVLMGSLGLPPGPWLERFAANEGFSYTDGYNYHYYGYAEDFTGVYLQHEAATAELASALRKPETGNLKPEGPTLAVRKELPVFLTEIGYGMLGKSARDTKEGRLRQWRWFKSVGQQANAVRIEAPMAFYLSPYLEYGTMEYGLTAPEAPTKPETGNLKPENLRANWTAGGITYVPGDFGAAKSEAWMEMIGTKIGGNEATPALAQWMALRARSRERGARSRSWSVTVPSPSPLVIDFQPGEGLSFVKRYNGHFVTGQSAEHGARSKEVGAPGSGAVAAKGPTDQQQPATKLSSEEFMLHVRTANGNLYEVYPTRQATTNWQTYLEHRDNFTMSFYGRAELPWRFGDNRPASLVMVLYPETLPATYEFRGARLIDLSEETPGLGKRYGRGQLVLYNFSDREIEGRLTLPECLAIEGVKTGDPVKLAPGERRVLEAAVTVSGDRFERIAASVTFLPRDDGISPARFVTEFFPALEGLKTAVVAKLLEIRRAIPHAPINAEFIRSHLRAAEEAPMTALQVSGFRSQVSDEVIFVQEGAKVEKTADGFAVTVAARPEGKERRVEVEIPWPDGLEFQPAQFLSLEYRLRP